MGGLDALEWPYPHPPPPPHLAAGFVDAGRGSLAQQVVRAPEVVGGALHRRHRCSPLCRQQCMGELQARHSRRHSTAAGTAPHGCPPPTCAWEAATLLRALPNPAARWDLSGPAAQQRRMQRSTGGESCKVEGGTSPLQNRNPRDCKTRSASIGCGWRRKCFSFLLEK